MIKYLRDFFIVTIGSLLLAMTSTSCGSGREPAISAPLALSAPFAPSASVTVPLASMSIKKPIFRFEIHGTFFKGDLSTGKWTQISSHNFDIVPQIVTSLDGRWISYSGNLKNWKQTQYWLYDKVTGRDRLYLEHPAWGGGIPSFSPDSKTIGVFVDYDTRWPKADGYGLYVIDSDTIHQTFLGNPYPIAKPPDPVWGFTRWSKDGNDLIVTVRTAFPRGTKDTWGNFAYRMADKKIESISSEDHRQGHGPNDDWYFRGKTRIAVHEEPHIQSKVGYNELASPGGRWAARIDGKYNLTVKSKDGVRWKVAKGSYDCCEGVTVGINGWLDERHMVYSIHHDVFVFDAESGRQAVLFTKKDRPAGFFW